MALCEVYNFCTTWSGDAEFLSAKVPDLLSDKSTQVAGMSLNSCSLVDPSSKKGSFICSVLSRVADIFLLWVLSSPASTSSILRTYLEVARCLGLPNFRQPPSRIGPVLMVFLDADRQLRNRGRNVAIAAADILKPSSAVELSDMFRM